MRDVVAELDYANYAMDFTAEEYRRAARVALYELWGYRREGLDSSGSDYRKQLDILDSHIEWLHEQPGYRRLKQELADHFQRLSEPQSYVDHTKSLRDQTRLYRAYRHIALHSDDEKIKELAGRYLKETHIPTVKVRHLEGRVVHMDVATARLIAETAAMLEKRRGPGADARAVHEAEHAPVEERGRREPLLLQSGSPPSTAADG